jgi:hypothetical protein
MHAHLEHPVAYGRAVSEVPRFHRAKPRKDSCLAKRVTQGTQPLVELLRAKQSIHIVSTWIQTIKRTLVHPEPGDAMVNIEWWIGNAARRM